MRKAVCAGLVGLWVLLPSPSGAWGFDLHRRITRRAIEGLPPALKPMYAPNIEFVVEHAVDPDEWRVVGLKSDLGAENPNHFFEIATMGEAAPFTGVPRDWTTLVARFGPEKADTIGRLPFRILEMYGRLVTQFRNIQTGTAYAAAEARYVSAILAHYVEDAHQPLHVAENYDGQLTGQRGLHARFENQVAVRAWPSLKMTPVTVAPIPDVTAYIFATIAASEARVQSILEADQRASAGLPHDANGRLVYDDRYYARFQKALEPLLAERLSAAASGVASIIVQAWTDAGRPVVR